MEVMNEESPQVGLCPQVAVVREAEHAQVLSGDLPHVSTSKKGVRKEHGEVADNGVLDGADVLHGVFGVPVGRNTLPNTQNLSVHLLIVVDEPLMREPNAITKFMVNESLEFIMHHKAHSHSAVLLVGVKGVDEGGDELDGEIAVGVHAEAGEEGHPSVLDHPLKVAPYPKTDKCVLVGPLRCGEHASQDLPILVVGGTLELRGLAATAATPRTLSRAPHHQSHGQCSEKFQRKIGIRFI
jgi:hypothetical protein